MKDKLNIAMLGHKRIPSREGGIEIVVEELSTRMVKLGHRVTCFNRKGHHVSGLEFDGSQLSEYKGVKLKPVWTLDKKGLVFAGGEFNKDNYNLNIVHPPVYDEVEDDE